ncbi:endothelin-converting enzyme homolog isoform X1 [Anoplophora glabripennis]|uniref:endothelin-converting enzyme homolog isoform X2 n=1 Tax=Anoplophora glabripennis TaxID=217634 RepID=UPI0008749F83|nr:endothelin-converting enzyme homolog isoform X2 [Anoplophora glabripennis]XP_023310493.1 endothelin-converting enzyme homolog isoform X1 [Anoplophora glabripennis]
MTSTKYQERFLLKELLKLQQNHHNKDEDASTVSWRNVIIINESTKKSEDELTTSYKDEDNGSTTNVPYVTNNDQNTSDISTEGINKGTSKEFILEGVIDQSTDESTTTENDAYLTTTESIDTGINDTLFYRDVIATEVTKNIKESTTTAVPPLPTTSIYTSHPTYYGNYRYPSFSTTEDENSSTEESTSENILSTARIPLLRSLSGSPYSTGTTDTANLESTTNTFRKIHYKGDTTERITTGGTFGTENDSSTTDLFRSTTKSGRLTRTTDAYHKNNYADSTTEDMTSASEMKSTYNEYDTTDVQEATGDYQRSNYKYASNLLTKDITTESWDSSTETETVSILNMTYTQTTTSVPLTTTERKNPFTSQPMKATTPPSAPQACASKVCKNTASKLLYLMNHDDDDSCENFFDFACGGQKIDEEYPKRKNLKMLINYLDRINGSAHKYLMDFKTFYGSCVKHEQSFKFMPRLEFLITSPNMSLTELFAELILTQSMPLFDIGVDNKMDSYIFEITLPGKSSLKNSVQGWSLMDQIRKECLDTLKLSKRKPEINLDKEYSSLQICQRERFKNIAEDFVEEIKRFLDYSPVFNETNLENLLSVMDWIQRSLPEEYDIQQTLIDKDYGMSSIEGLKSAIDSSFVEWEAIFRKITFQGASDRTLIVYFKNYLESLFKMLTNKFNKWELFDMLWLYSRLQLYVNTVVSKEREDREMYCMDLAKQIMPNTVSVITYKVTGDQTFATYKVQSFFEKLKQKLTESIQNSKLEDATKDMLQERLKKVSLGMITTGDHTAAINNNQVLTLTENDYQANVVESLRNYRRIVYSLAGTEATPASLLRYFVDPFSTRPKLFEARNVIVAQAAFIKKYALRVPKHISFATIGMHLSRELANVVTNGTIREKQYYQDLMTYTKDLLIIYANYTYNVQGSTVFFNITQNLWINQMIVDNTAFKLTLNCFNELGGFDKPNVSSLPWMVSDYPVNKEFFIAAAQEYCREYSPLDFMEDLYVTGNLPPPLRVQNFLSNSEEFATVFNCPEGSPMAVQKEMIAQFPNLDYSYDYSGISN